MSVKRAVLPFGCWPSRRDFVVTLTLALGVSWLVAACSFDTQPLFEPSRTDPATGTATDAAVVTDGAAAEQNVSTASSMDGGIGPSNAADASPAGGSTCLPLQVVSCVSGRALTCRADGSGFDELDCGAAGCNAAANGCNECLPDRSTCDGSTLTRCGADGRVQAREMCSLGCVGVVGGQASCRVCEPGASMCSGKDVARCAPDGLSWQTQKCADGCDAAARTCVGARVVAVNIPRDACRMENLPDHDEDAELSVNTDETCTRVIQQAAGQPEICVHAYRQLRVRDSAVIRVKGSRPLAILATRSMRIEGRISVSARGTEPGAGSTRGPVGAGQPGVGRLADGTSPGPGAETVDWDVLPANAGGGGGGHATPGAPGGDAPGMCGAGMKQQACAAGGLGGAMHGSEQLSPLHGGASGGANSASDESTRGNEAGGGGGAIQLVACEELILGEHAVIDANGGGGEGGGSGSLENAANETPGAGAGGGSGGAILIQTRSLRASAGSVLVANGGGGGGGASRMNNARALLSDGENGQDGLLSSHPAAGGAPAGQSQPGGAGGALTPPVPGGTAKMRTQAAGGGGGAAGRIRIEIGPGDAILEGVVISPPASRGSVLFE